MRRTARRRRALFILVLLFLVALLLTMLFLKSDWMGRWMYPIHYENDIRISAKNYDLDPLLIAAVIRVETNYSPDAVSGKGAVGIMQLMPDTAEWIMKKGGFTPVPPEMLSARADISIELGSWYLHSLHKQFDGKLYAALAAYNAGPGTVKRWISEGTWDGKLETVKQIPYGETRHYVQRVIYYYNKYKKLYTEF
ncbi:lytic transglycosylase domain-containing protein [Paenibacillus oenotherae]|uniref:Lytic transglycosylase domain-containing protein n=1 Tax=Paenibacillus oenotherae TaxID=1435645 RepID=A0ABS7D9N3_9BACL|nr:lytic transglycosylase domain-containing protein [Paenibacillus oenotherae]MBW7476662.1 lytic transglycosylase domain-containing protein [Paenibacillus oenotherae]